MNYTNSCKSAFYISKHIVISYDHNLLSDETETPMNITVNLQRCDAHVQGLSASPSRAARKPERFLVRSGADGWQRLTGMAVRGSLQPGSGLERGSPPVGEIVP
jgi:hypothetical protein